MKQKGKFINKKGMALDYIFNRCTSKNICLIVPGLGEDIKEESYSKISEILNRKNISTVRINLSNNKLDELNFEMVRLSEHINDICIAYNKFSSTYENIYLFGFSFGSVSAFIVSAIKPIKKQILCSPGYFYDYLSKKDKEKIFFDFVQDLKNHPWKNYSKRIIAETFLLYGSKELDIIKNKANEIFNTLKCPKHIIEIPNAIHDINQNEYLSQISKIVDTL